MKRKLVIVLTFCLLVTFILSGCSKPSAPTPDATQAPIPTSTTTPAATAEPTATPDPEPIPCTIVFESNRDGRWNIFSMAPDGSNLVQLTKDQGDNFSPSWSPDGDKIAFVSNRPTDDQGGGGQFIYIMNADGSDVQQITNEENCQNPDWSNDYEIITYSNNGEIYLTFWDGSKESVRLTNSPEEDRNPVISPDGSKIAWLSGKDDYWNLFVMNRDGSDVRQITDNGKAYSVAWTIDGQLFSSWEHPEGICGKCVMDWDGANPKEAGGKGEIQQYLPFWTLEGDRVECISGEMNGQEEILLVSPIFEDIFLNLTNNQAIDRNPDWPAHCADYRNDQPEENTSPDSKTYNLSNEEITIGYTGSINPQDQSDFDKACRELGVECVHADSVAELADMGVDAIVNRSNKWDVQGSAPQIQDAFNRGIAVFELNVISDTPGVFNLTGDYANYTATFEWMFEKMGGQGDFVYYNFGDNGYVQNQLDAVLKNYPGINTIKKSADYDGNTFTEQDILDLIASNPKLGAIWSSENQNQLFWAIVNKSNSHMPVTECMARTDELISWKNEMDAGTKIDCIAHILPGGTAYEGIYAAYYYLSGLKFRSDAFIADGSSTLKYEIPEITNENLPVWIGPKLDALRVADYGFLSLPPMTPEEIKSKWFE